MTLNLGKLTRRDFALFTCAPKYILQFTVRTHLFLVTKANEAPALSGRAPELIDHGWFHYIGRIKKKKKG